MTIHNWVSLLHQYNLIHDTHYYFYLFVQKQYPDEPIIPFLALLSSYELTRGNVCILIQEAILNTYLQYFSSLLKEYEPSSVVDHCWNNYPPTSKWSEILIQAQSTYQPSLLVYSHSRLYLHRYWKYEKNLAYQLHQRANSPLPIKYDIASIEPLLEQLFPAASTETEPDGQKIAAILSLQKKLTVISGGPGTGKTTTVTKILAILVTLYLQQNQIPTIRIVAPTGKAAHRLQQSLMEQKQQLLSQHQIEERILAIIPDTSSTIHRLLKIRSTHSNQFIHDAQNPLFIDILLVDEASMIDLALMSKLMDALPEHCQCIFLGDKEQLTSIEAGNILTDLCQFLDYGYSSKLIQQLQNLTTYTPEQLKKGRSTPKKSSPHPAIADCIALLFKSYRFTFSSGIGALAKAINNSDIATVKTLLQQQNNYSDITFIQNDHPPSLLRAVSALALKHYQDYLYAIEQGKSVTTILLLFEKFRILSPLRKGLLGVENLNQHIEAQLQQQQLLKITHSPWYAGRPVMINGNHYNLQLFNGDIGITLPDKDNNNTLRVFFKAEDNTLRKILPIRMPSCETVYAMTIHKSQGSEFDNVAVVLSDLESDLLSKELLYTAITRAKKHLSLYTSENSLQTAIEHKIRRISGLHAQLLHLATKDQL